MHARRRCTQIRFTSYIYVRRLTVYMPESLTYTHYTQAPSRMRYTFTRFSVPGCHRGHQEQFLWSRTNLRQEHCDSAAQLRGGACAWQCTIVNGVLLKYSSAYLI